MDAKTGLINADTLVPRFSPGQLLDQNPEEHVRGMIRHRRRNRLEAARFPPIDMLAQQRPRMVQLALVTDPIRQFFIEAIDDRAPPFWPFASVMAAAPNVLDTNSQQSIGCIGRQTADRRRSH